MLDRLRNIFGLEKRWTAADPYSPDLAALFGAVPTHTGVAVTTETAMRCPTVLGCVRVISESVGQLPIILHRRTETGRERATDHPLYDLLHDEPNAWTSAYEFKVAMQTALCLHGNAYAFVNRVNGRIAELVQIPSSTVTVEVDEMTLEPSYKVAEKGGGQRVYDRSQILHLRGIGSRPHVGDSPVHLMREAIGLALTMEHHGARIFGNGARPSGTIEVQGGLSPEAVERLRASLRSEHSGAASGRTMVLEGGAVFKALQFNSVDMQFMELRRQQIAEIARGYRVPLHMLQELERTTHANAESLGQQFITFTLLPWLKAWEGAIRRTLISPDERSTLYAEFLTDDLARADLAARMSAYATAITNGVLSPNEARAAENRPPYPGGDQFRLPMNTEDASGEGETDGE